MTTNRLFRLVSRICLRGIPSSWHIISMANFDYAPAFSKSLCIFFFTSGERLSVLARNIISSYVGFHLHGHDHSSLAIL